MGKRPFLFIMVFCVLWLVACEQAAPTPLPTATAVPPQPTATATKPPTATPSPTIVSVETAVVTPIHFPETEVEPSEHFPNEVTPTVPPLILDPWRRPFPEIEREEISYQLKYPDENLLLELLVNRSYDAKGEGFLGFMPINAGFEALLLQDIDRYYEGELPNSKNLVRYDTLHFMEQVVEPLESSWKAIRAGTIQFLNEEGVIFENGVEYKTPYLKITPHVIDLNNDSEADWLLQVSAIGHSVSVLIPLTVQPDGFYELIPNDFPSESTNILYQNEVLFDYDLTGDDLPEIIWHTQSYWGRGYFEEIRIFGWNGQKLEFIDAIDLSRSAETPAPHFSIGDFNNDSLNAIEIFTEDVGNFECQIKEKTIYSWSDTVPSQDFQRQISTPACYIWESVYRKPENTIFELQSALTEFEPSNATNASLIALARVHLAMTQIALGQSIEAQATLEEIYNLPTDAKFVRLVLQAYELAGKRPLQTCRNLLTDADNLLQTEIGEYLSYESADPYMANFGGVDGKSPHWATICNLEKTVDNIVNGQSLSVDILPLTSLTTQDIPYEFATHINLDSDPELEWIGVLESQDLLIFDAVDGVWQPRIIWLSSEEVTDIVIGERDVTGDGLEDFIVLVTGRNYCQDLKAQTDFQELKIIYTEDESIRLVGNSIDCQTDALLDIEDVTATNFTEKQMPFLMDSQFPVWQKLTDFSATDLSLPEYIQEIQTAVLTQSDPDIPTKITDLLAYLPTDDPEAQPYREHLTYLLGYHYELNGEEEQAVATYLDLIQQAPSSPWSWLAWARLEPVE